MSRAKIPLDEAFANKICKMLNGVSEMERKEIFKLTNKLQDDSYAAGYVDGMADCEAVYLGKYDH